MSDEEVDCIQVQVLKDQVNDEISDFFKRKHLETYLRKSSKSEMRKSQKSHYTVIMISNIWSVVASIPYSVFSYYLAVIYLHHGKDYIFEARMIVSCLKMLYFSRTMRGADEILMIEAYFITMVSSG